MNIFFYTIFIFCTNYVSGRVARTPLGDLIGTQMKSRNGKEYYAFMSIPYAKPPVGNLRFKNPEAIGAWKGLLDGRERPPFCPQILIHSPRKAKYVVGEEDCLYLNIFSLSYKIGLKMSVMVYFVGDNFRYGMANDQTLGRYLIDENIILVIVQHRLGALGFLSTEDNLITGNFGLKDQSMALLWIQKYIKYFGGNPLSITVFGDGSGGASAHYLALRHKDIIKSVISQGGVGNNIWAMSKSNQAKKIANNVFKMLNCTNDILKCLKQKDFKDIMKTEYDLIYWDMEPNVVFQPVIEKNKIGSFFNENPLKQKTNFPWMLGFTSDEGQYKIYSMETQSQDELRPFVNNARNFIKNMFYEHDSIEMDITMDLIMNKYFNDLNDRKKTLQGLKDFYGYLNYVVPTFQALERHTGPKYLYVFDFKFKSTPQAASETHKYQGAPHAEETVALFDWGEPLADENEEFVSKQTARMWANFAKYQKPTTGRLNWPMFKNGEYMIIKRNSSIDTNYKKEDIDFWLNLPIFKSI